MPRKAPVLTVAAALAIAKPTTPRLWNAKRRIKSGKLLNLNPHALRIVQNDDSEAWKKLVSEDVVKFIEDAKLSPFERRRCVKDPNRYFSFPGNVPNALRKQVYLYETVPYICQPVFLTA